jgi:hypothetical protein
MLKTDKILAEISVGDLADKITILEIKQNNIKDKDSLRIINKELISLQSTLEENVTTQKELVTLISRLKEINKTLWDVEDDIRDCERNKSFGEDFIALARKVYFTNDQRAKTKKDINRLTHSNIEEIKSYQSY